MLVHARVHALMHEGRHLQLAVHHRSADATAATVLLQATEAAAAHAVYPRVQPV